MKGCIALNEEQVTNVLKSLSLRDRAWVTLGFYTGLRITAILSLTIENISKDFSHIKINKADTKGQTQSRTLPLHPIAKEALKNWVSSNIDLNGSVFVSRKGGSLDRRSAHRILSGAIKQAGISGLPGQLGTHVMRKTFARRMFKFFGNNLIKTQIILDHKSILSTIQYLTENEEEVYKAFLA